MCSPGLAIVGTQAFSASSGTVGSIFSAMGARAGLKAQARIAELNAKMADKAAQRSIERGQFEEQKLRLARADLKGKQRAAMGANNVIMSEGSALNEQVSTDYLTEIDAQNIQLNALHEAFGYRNQGLGYRMDATMKRGEAKGISPFMAGTASLIAGVGNVASSWYQLNRQGAFTQGGGGGSGYSGASGYGQGGWDYGILKG